MVEGMLEIKSCCANDSYVQCQGKVLWSLLHIHNFYFLLIVIKTIRSSLETGSYQTPLTRPYIKTDISSNCVHYIVMITYLNHCV
jgi:hypothetical protein